MYAVNIGKLYSLWLKKIGVTFLTRPEFWRKGIIGVDSAAPWYHQGPISSILGKLAYFLLLLTGWLPWPSASCPYSKIGWVGTAEKERKQPFPWSASKHLLRDFI